VQQGIDYVNRMAVAGMNGARKGGGVDSRHYANGGLVEHENFQKPDPRRGSEKSFEALSVLGSPLWFC
jgi:hypothetical protein